MNTLSHKKLTMIKLYSPKCYTLRQMFISVDASVTIMENKSAELITENESVEAITESESVEAITENERAENNPLERMLAD